MSATDAVTVFEALTTQHWLVEPDSVPGLGAPPIRCPKDPAREHLRGREAGDDGTRRTGRRHGGSTDARSRSRRSRLRTTTCRRCAPAGSRRSSRRDPLSVRRRDARRTARRRAGRRAHLARRSVVEVPLGCPSPAADRSITRAPRASSRRSSSAPTSAKPQYVYERSFAQSLPDPASAAADIARSYLWRAGRWADALDGFDPRRYFAGRFRDSSPTHHAGQLEMWAESGFAELARAFTSRPELAEMAIDLRRRASTARWPTALSGFALLGLDATRRTRIVEHGRPRRLGRHGVVAGDDMAAGAPSPGGARRPRECRPAGSPRRCPLRPTGVVKGEPPPPSASAPARPRHACRRGAGARKRDAVQLGHPGVPRPRHGQRAERPPRSRLPTGSARPAASHRAAPATGSTPSTSAEATVD